MIDINPEYIPNHSDFTLSIKYYPDKEKIDELAVDWNTVVEIFNKDLEQKVSTAKAFLRQMYTENPDIPIFVSTSTGKDSEVSLDLINRVLNPSQYKVVWCNTSLDSADTYRIVNQHDDWIKLNPKEGFYNWIRRLGFIPTRFNRGCCNLYKEQATVTYFKHIYSAVWVMGLRNAESYTRSTYTKIWNFPQWEKANLDWKCYSPILRWTDLNVWLYILKYHLTINPKYKKGYTRVGCNIACPFYTKSTWCLDEYWYSKGYQRWHRILHQDLIKNKKWANLNCTSREYHFNWNGGLVRKIPTEQVKQDMIQETGLSSNVVDNYFNHTCDECHANVRNSTVLAMNMKFNGRNTNKFLCKRCFKKLMNWKESDWNKQINTFEEQGCELF